MLLRRLGFFVLTLWAALTLNFLIPRLMPGNPAQRDDGHASTASCHRTALTADVEASFGINTHQNIVRRSTSSTCSNMVTGHFGDLASVLLSASRSAR